MKKLVCTPITFCCKADVSASEAVELIQKAYGDAAVSRTTIFEWHKRFREGRESVKDDERSGRPSTSQTDDNIAFVAKMFQEDRRVTSRLIADALGIPKTVVLRFYAKICSNENCAPDLSRMP